MKKIVLGLVVLVICLISISAKEVKMDGYYEFKNDDGSLDWNSFYAKIEEIGKQGVFDYISLVSYVLPNDVQYLDGIEINTLPSICLYRKFLDGGNWRGMVFCYKASNKINLFYFHTSPEFNFGRDNNKVELVPRKNIDGRQKAIEEFKMVLELM